jgi:hypothetical protein
MEDQPTVLWSLERDGRTVSCRAKLVPYGIEIDLTSDGAAVVTRVFETGEEAMAWAGKKRSDREAAGWRAVGSEK